MKVLGMDFGCATGSLRDGKFPDKDCLLPLISKLLGYAIVAASTTVKVPQIMKILKNKSVRGLSVVGFELEVVGYTIALAYCLHKGLPFSAYGELAFLLIQAIILVAIIYYFSQPVRTTTWIRALLYCAVAPTILAGQIEPFLFEALYVSDPLLYTLHCNLFIRNCVPTCDFSLCQDSTDMGELFCKLEDQVYVMLLRCRNKSTGELSFLTCFMNFGGGLVRVFTSMQEKAPTSVVLGSLLGMITNGTILSQIIFYRKPETKKEKKIN
ncbi:hypothetical protein POTOM_046105 [Populus tomentosa]|uniref:Mannose-P-dolichol utilization defect 1 protein homolog n=1 Tax=Populus tomentosa TaxID=118781 RepID=A0A8X7Y9U9_POPTO|nr:hypothetical protein POTOM_046105 [Populus tomentosa]